VKKRLSGSRILATAALALVVAATAGCPTQNNAKPLKYKIGFLLTLDHPYWHGMQRAAIDEGKKLDAEVLVLNAKEDPALQIQQIQEMIAKQVDAVCLAPMKKEALITGVKALNEAKIPVIIVNRDIGEGCDYVCYVGTDSYHGAVVSAKILMEAIGGEGKIVEFHQHLGTGPEKNRSRALAEALQEYPNVKCVARLPHKGERARVIAAMQTLLEQHPDLKGVYAHGDMFALAASEACRQIGRPEVATVGMGGSKEAIQAIRDGRLTGTSFQQPEQEGRRAVQLAVKALGGEKLEKAYPIECPPITKENADQFEGQF